LQEYFNNFGSSKSKMLRIVKSYWNDTLEEDFVKVKDVLKKSVRLTHPDLKRERQEICLFTDAEDKFCSAMLTQVPKEDL
jgi:hypothetical protein